jgi:hypothetical protein
MLGAITAILYGLPLAVTVFDTRESQLLIRTLGPLLRLRPSTFSAGTQPEGWQRFRLMLFS